MRTKVMRTMEDIIDEIKTYNDNYEEIPERLLNEYRYIVPTVDNGFVPPSDSVEVEVVRCKDCKYYKQSFSALFPQEVAYICDNPYGLKKNPDKKDFCRHGERK